MKKARRGKARVTYCPQAEAMYIELKSGRSADTIELVRNRVIIDLSATGEVMGVEILEVKKYEVPSDLL